MKNYLRERRPWRMYVDEDRLKERLAKAAVAAIIAVIGALATPASPQEHALKESGPAKPVTSPTAGSIIGK